MNKHAYRRLAWLGGVLLTIILVITAIQRKKRSDTGEIKIEIKHLENGNDLIKEADVRTAISRGFGYNLKGMPVAEMEVDRVEQVLKEVPFIKTAEAYIDATNHLSVRITQREPILRVIDNNGQNYYLDAEGMKIPTSRHFTARVLVATGNIPPYSPDFQERKKYLLKDLFTLTRQLQDQQLLKSMIEQVFVNTAGEFIMIPKVGDQKILLGNVDNLEDKFHRLEVFYKKGLPYTGWNVYSSINVKYKGQIVCKKR